MSMLKKNESINLILSLLEEAREKRFIPDSTCFLCKSELEAELEPTTVDGEPVNDSRRRLF